jgi:uncharacterized protein
MMQENWWSDCSIPKLNVKIKHLDQIKDILRKHIPDAEVWAYGSRLGHNSHGGSDLDLAARNKENPDLPVEGLTQVREALSESNIPFLVDIHDWSRLPDSFCRQILKNMW